MTNIRVDAILHFETPLLWAINTLRLRQNGHHFPDILKYLFFNENIWILITILLKLPKGPTHHIPAFVQIMAWCWPGDKPLSEPMMDSLLIHTYVSRPQWVNEIFYCTVNAVSNYCVVAWWHNNDQHWFIKLINVCLLPVRSCGAYYLNAFPLEKFLIPQELYLKIIHM